MRGKQHDLALELADRRITPADAGKTGRCFPEQDSDEDHPRGCGENTGRQKGCIIWLGSPPRMRGKQETEISPKKSARITPADAGKTWKFFFHSPEL